MRVCLFRADFFAARAVGAFLLVFLLLVYIVCHEMDDTTENGHTKFIYIKLKS